MLEIGTLLQNRYCLQQCLNDNQARQTWLAEDQQSQTQVIVKLLALGGPVQWDDLKLFEREAQVLKMLSHPLIPACLDYFSVDDRTLWFGLVQNYIAGTSLKQQLVQGQRFTEEQVQQVAVEVLALLDYLHQRTPPVLHRDIKPSNLIWGEDNRLYLIDFGAVQARPKKLGETFTVVGTYGYTPMEQFGGQAVPASDLYALGATLIHLLTGVAPADLPQADLRLQFRDRIPAQLNPNFIRWLEKLIEPAVDRRFQSVQEALKALQSNPVAALDPPDNTTVRLYKSPDRLQIEIPSLFEIQLLRPLRLFLQRGRVFFSQRLSEFNPFKRPEGDFDASLLGRQEIDFDASLRSLAVLAIAGSAGVVAIAILVGLFPFLLSGGAVFLVIWLILLSKQKINYFGRTRLSFDNKMFELSVPTLSQRQLERNTLNQIEAVELNFDPTLANRYRYSISITIRSKRSFFFFGKPTKHYNLGNHLNKAELQWLLQEIRTWLRDRTDHLDA